MPNPYDPQQDPQLYGQWNQNHVNDGKALPGYQSPYGAPQSVTNADPLTPVGPPATSGDPRNPVGPPATGVDPQPPVGPPATSTPRDTTGSPNVKDGATGMPLTVPGTTDAPPKDWGVPTPNTSSPTGRPTASPNVAGLSPQDAFMAATKAGLTGSQVTDYLKSQGFSDNGLYYADNYGYGFANFVAVPNGSGGYAIEPRQPAGTPGTGYGGVPLTGAPTPMDGTTPTGGTATGSTPASTPSTAPPDTPLQGDQLMQILLQRAQQGTNVNPNDPIIQNQVDAYSAQRQGAARTALAAQAEKQGANTNVDAETRLANEQTGQDTASFQSGLVSRELQSRRDEIQNALTSMQAYLTDQQKMSLQKQLAEMDNALQYARLNEQGSEFGRGLDQRAYEFDADLQNRILGS